MSFQNRQQPNNTLSCQISKNLSFNTHTSKKAIALFIFVNTCMTNVALHCKWIHIDNIRNSHNIYVIGILIIEINILQRLRLMNKFRRGVFWGLFYFNFEILFYECVATYFVYDLIFIAQHLLGLLLE